MKRAAIIAAALVALAAGVAIAAQGWQDDQDAQQFTLTNASQIGVGSLPLSPSVAVGIENSQNSSLVQFVANPNAGTAATAFSVYQAAASSGYGLPPYTELGNLGLGFSDANAPLFVGGSGVLAYNGIQGLIIDMGTTIGGAPPLLFVKHAGTIQTIMGQFDYATQAFSLPATMSGSGNRCAEVDAAGVFHPASAACGSGSGTVTSVSGTTGRIVVTPSSPNPVVDLATFGTASTCAWANVVTDAWGRTTCTANTAPQPAGSYITALTHDAIASGPGSASTEVVGITDGTSVDHPVAAGAWTNGQALALDGSGDIHTAAFQAPIAGSTCGANTFATSISSAGAITCTQPAFTNLSGSLACSQLPAFTGAVSNGGGGSCATTVNFSGLTGSASCAQLPALTGAITSAGGTCATSYAGMPASTQVAVGAGATSAPTGSANLTFSSGNLHVSNSVQFGGLSASSLLATDGSSFATTAVIGSGLTYAANTLSANVAVQLHYSLQFLAMLNAGEIVEGGRAPNPVGAIGTLRAEYPAGVASGSVTLLCYLQANRITSGTYAFAAARSGADTAASISLTSASVVGVYSSSATVGSPSVFDTWGLDVTTVGTSSSCGSGLCNSDLYCTMTLSP